MAGAGVLVSSFLAALVGALIFLDHPRIRFLFSPEARVQPPQVLHVVLVALALVSLVVVVSKVRVQKGTLVKGGVVSAHSALGFMLSGMIWVLSTNALLGGLALGLALLVAQSRVDTGVHTLREVLLGALIGLVVTLALAHFMS